VSGPEALDLVVEVVHDLRSPLTSIVMLSESLLRGLAGTATPAQRRQLGLIYGASLGLSSVTSDVIDLARSGDRLMERDPEPFSIAAVFESVRSIVDPIAEERAIELRTIVTTSDHRIGGRMALGRVLLNLTTNALRFTDAGFVEITANTVAGDRVAFSVRDTGPGITAEALATLYQPFHRMHNRRADSVSESGLGLTICRKLAHRMRSELRVETRPGWGTRMFFEVDLPEVLLHEAT
jgi:signal transduction histidine kinase